MPLRRITSLEVARQAGVSRTTVSLVLNDVPGTQISEQTRNRVIQAAEELGYVPDAAAKALASQRTQVIALILTRSPHHIASDAFLTQILDSLVQTSHQNRMRLMIDIVEDEHHPHVYLDLTRARSIDGDRPSRFVRFWRSGELTPSGHLSPFADGPPKPMSSRAKTIGNPGLTPTRLKP